MLSPPTPVDADASAPAAPTDDELLDLAATALDAALSSADVDTIGAAYWWDRACAALTTAAAASTSWPQTASRLAAKLQIVSYTAASSRTLTEVGTRLADPSVYARWQRLAARDAVYVTALVRVARTARRADREAVAADRPAPDPQETLL